jgi:hypothetical protein
MAIVENPCHVFRRLSCVVHSFGVRGRPRTTGCEYHTAHCNAKYRLTHWITAFGAVALLGNSLEAQPGMKLADGA